MPRSSANVPRSSANVPRAPQVTIPDDFNFADYLTRCVSHILSEVVEIGVAGPLSTSALPPANFRS
eukprot:2537437-Rhodomonas_salina.1